jgi:hypothetical protein
MHSDSANDGDHECDHCGEQISNCADTDKDHLCDDCDALIGQHADSANDGDHVCDYCKSKIGGCKDTDKDHNCDECGATITSHNYENGYCTVCGGTEPAYTPNGKKITFGSYPQSEVTDSNLKSVLSSKAGTLPTSSNSQRWTSYEYYIEGEVQDYMWYIDVEQDGEWYRGVYFTSYRPWYTTDISSEDYSMQDDSGYIKGNVYWFKYEPISWTILSENATNGTALILCDMIIDSQAFYENDDVRTVNGNTVYPNNYEYSFIRKWLNDVFLGMAFSDIQKQQIVITTLDNSAESTKNRDNPYICNDVDDKVFLLSYSETEMIEDYIKESTDYAQVQGVYWGQEPGYDEPGSWWLRSPYYNDYGSVGNDYMCVSSVGNGGSYANRTYEGIVPALQIRL